MFNRVTIKVVTTNKDSIMRGAAAVVSKKIEETSRAASRPPIEINRKGDNNVITTMSIREGAEEEVAMKAMLRKIMKAKAKVRKIKS